MKINGDSIIEYNNENANIAIANINTFEADFGGTEIMGPLMAC
jgi:hypothetical protein